MRFRLAVAVVVAAVLGAPGTAIADPTSTSLPGADPAAAPTTMSPLVADPTAFVDPMIGTGRGGATVGEINNFPGPSTPFGMMQFSPDTQGSYAGYQYHSDRIRASASRTPRSGARRSVTCRCCPSPGTSALHPGTAPRSSPTTASRPSPATTR
ncbi:hypothetical protein ACFWN2_03465 [Lentzea sp. NPDC058436]|uniref:hypothetical protein n=1 Tax=Lentzea sp. NPDC058436 TaxID=3346499 RepID=UPI00366119D0